MPPSETDVGTLICDGAQPAPHTRSKSVPMIKFMDKMQIPEAEKAAEPADQAFDAFQKRVEEQKKLEKTLTNIKHKIIVMSGKGGVGKSTVATNLAVAFAKMGKKTGILDVDITGPDIPLLMGVEGQRLTGDEEGIRPVVGPLGVKIVSMEFLLQDPETPVVWRGPMKMGAIRQFLTDVNWGQLDYLIIDLPPGTSDEPLTVAQTIKDAEGVVIVTTPQDVANLDIRKSTNFARMLNLKVLGIVENMSGLDCPHCGKGIDLFKRGGGERSAQHLGVPFLGRIPFDLDIVRTGDSGEPFVESHAESPAAKAFMQVVERITAGFETPP